MADTPEEPQPAAHTSGHTRPAVPKRKRNKSRVDAAAGPAEPATGPRPATPKTRPNRPNRKTPEPGAAKPNPKFLEINKLIKHYHPKTVNGMSVTALTRPLVQHLRDCTDNDLYLYFEMRPSDPDFPFDLPVLQFSLFIPAAYPFYQHRDKVTSPSIAVLNADIPKGFSLNIEAGFREIVEMCKEQKTNSKKQKRNRNKKAKKTADETDDETGDAAGTAADAVPQAIQLVAGTDLTSILATLDKYLERFLSREKRETIKIVRYAKARSASPAVAGAGAAAAASPAAAAAAPAPAPSNPTLPPVPPEYRHARAVQVHKLLTRLGPQLQMKKFKSTQFNDIYSVKLPLWSPEDPANGLHIAAPDLALKELPCRLHIPADYLYNEAKPIKLEIDKNFVVSQIAGYTDSHERLAVSSRIHKIASNFNTVAAVAFLQANRADLHDVRYSLTSQLNFFVHNCGSLMEDGFQMGLV